METDTCGRETKTVSKLKVWTRVCFKRKNILFAKVANVKSKTFFLLSCFRLLDRCSATDQLTLHKLSGTVLCPLLL